MFKTDCTRVKRVPPSHIWFGDAYSVVMFVFVFMVSKLVFLVFHFLFSQFIKNSPVPLNTHNRAHTHRQRDKNHPLVHVNVQTDKAFAH